MSVLAAINHANALRNYESLVLSLGPYAYYPRPTNTTDAVDITGNGKDITGTCQVVESPVPGKLDWAFGFTAASNNRLGDDDFGNYTYPITLACWAYFLDFNAGRALMSLDDNSANNRFTLLVKSVDGAIRGVRASGGTVVNATTSTSIAANTWCHCAAVFASATDCRVYLNAGGEGSNVTSKTPGATTGLSIGTLGEDTTVDINGSLAHPAIFLRELTIDELIALYQVGLYGA